MTRVKLAALLSAIFLVTSIGFAVNSKSQNQNDPLEQLKSDDWEQRAKAFYKFRSIDPGPEGKEIKNALLDLLDRENQLLMATLRESNGEKGVSFKYGEAYSEYYSDLLRFVEAQSDLSHKRTLSIIVHGGYDPESVFAQKLLSRGEEIVPLLLEMLMDDFSGRRWKSVEMLGQLATRYRSKVSDQTVERIKQVLTQSLNDNSELVRQRAAQLLQKIKN